MLIAAACGTPPEPKHATDADTGSGPFVDNKGYKPKTFRDDISGEGRPVIFIPGLGCPGEMFDPVIKHLDGKVEAHVLTLASDEGLIDNGLKLRTLRLPDRYQDHDKPERQYAEAGLDADGMVATVLGALRHNDLGVGIAG